MAFGNSTFSDAAGAVSDIFAAKGMRLKAEGNRLEATNYDAAAEMADKNAKFTKLSTDIKLYQTDREIMRTLGDQGAEVAGAGFRSGGSALDLLRDSASQGALSEQVINQQGLITEDAQTAQATAYRNMAASSRLSADAQDQAAKGADISAGIKGLAAVATLFT